jgi:hypothetical protein
MDASNILIINKMPLNKFKENVFGSEYINAHAKKY